MKKIILSTLCLFTILYCQASTTIPAGNILNGNWTLAGSPYLITGDLEIINSLNIEPGVEVIFQGHYGIKVKGTLRAVGTGDDRIIFKAQDTTGWHIDSIPQGGWKGIYFEQFSSSNNWTDSSQFEFCDIQDVKFGATNQNQASYYNYTIYVLNRDMKILDCNIFHNQSATTNFSTGVIIQVYQDLLSNKKVEIARCDIHDNITWLGVVYLSQWKDPKYQTVYHVHHNKFHDNLGATSSVYGIHTEMLYEYNEVYNNTCDDRGAHASGISLIQGKNIIRSNRLHHNLLHSSASIACNAGQTTIEKNFIHNNYMSASGSLCGISGGGAGIHMAHNQNAPLDSTRFIVRDNIIANNQANFAGAGIHMVRGNAEIYNNHILNNVSNGPGSAISALGVQYTKLKISNNIFWDNGNSNAHSIRVACDTFTFDYNLLNSSCSSTLYNITGVLSGDTIHNIVGQNPNLMNPTLSQGYLTDATNSNFQLLSNSPCIETGNSSGFTLNSTDYYGNGRVQGNFIDIGAHEYESVIPNSVTEILQNELAVYPNPSSIGQHIRLKLLRLQDAQLIISNMQGELIKRVRLTNGQYDLNTKDFTAGVYLIKLYNRERSYTHKMVLY